MCSKGSLAMIFQEQNVGDSVLKIAFHFWTDVWLSGVLTTGELFLWNKDQDCLKMIQVTEKPKEVIKATVGRDVLNFVWLEKDWNVFILLFW